MKSKFSVLLSVLLFAAVLASSMEAAALRVVVVKTDDVGAYVQELEKGKALLKKLGSPATLRVWRAVAAGPNAGQVVVSIEYADMVAYAKDYQMVSTNCRIRGLAEGPREIAHHPFGQPLRRSLLTADLSPPAGPREPSSDAPIGDRPSCFLVCPLVSSRATNARSRPPSHSVQIV